VQSLNVSVASAVILYEAQRQRQAAGMYDNEVSSVDPETIHRLMSKDRSSPMMIGGRRCRKSNSL
ncbi:MAG: hypothetical protein AAGJ78_15540, partial [Pseudomonadota bacterium]